MVEKHLSSQFDVELSGISTRVLEMGGLVEAQVAQAVQALVTFSGELAIEVVRQHHDADTGAPLATLAPMNYLQLLMALGGSDD